MTSHLTLEKFECEGEPTSVGARWERWKRALLVYLEASGITDCQKKRASLLHFGGIELQDIFYNTPGANIDPKDAKENEDVFSVALSKLDDFFTPKQSTMYERHLLRLIKQEPDEKFEKFIVRLRNQADKCQYKDKEEHIMDQITEKCSSAELRKKILQMGQQVTLNKIIVEANTLEAVNNQLKEFGSTSNPTHDINKIEFRSKGRFEFNRKGKTGCGRCGNPRHASRDPLCPAREKSCLKCGLKGHFRQLCRTKQAFKRKIESRSNEEEGNQKKNKFTDKREVNQMSQSKKEKESEDLNYVFHIDDDVEFGCNIGGVKVKMLVDSGCKQNLITSETWTEMKNNKAVVSNQIANPDIKFTAYGSNTPLKVKGSFEALVQIGNKSEKSIFYVIDKGTRNLLGKRTAMSLGILKIGLDLDINSVELTKMPKFNNVLIELPIDNSVAAVSQPYRYD